MLAISPIPELLYRPGRKPQFSLMRQRSHRWLHRLLLVMALLIPLAAVCSDDVDAFMQQWQIDEEREPTPSSRDADRDECLNREANAPVQAASVVQ